MSTGKHFRQDLAPKGGYPAIRFVRNIPHRTISGALVGGAMTALAIWGGFQLGSMWRERREIKREKSWARLYILPLVQAEWDREWLRWRQSELAQEAEIMKDVPEWKVGESVYNNDYYAPNRFDLQGNPVRPPFIRWVDTGEPM